MALAWVAAATECMSTLATRTDEIRDGEQQWSAGRATRHASSQSVSSRTQEPPVTLEFAGTRIDVEWSCADGPPSCSWYWPRFWQPPVTTRGWCRSIP